MQPSRPTRKKAKKKNTEQAAKVPSAGLSSKSNPGKASVRLDRAAGRLSKEAASNPDGPVQETEDEATPERVPMHPFTVVGIGASAGGYEAFRELLENLPGDTGMAFVFVQHL